jgi:polar amino acid transport system substrate-binding protein
MLKILFLLLLFSPSIAAKQEVTLGVVLFEPFSMIDSETNECIGEAINITKRILSEYNVDVEVVCANASRIYKLIENAEVDFSINVKTTNALANNVEFIDQPFTNLRLNLYSRISDSKQRTVAAIRGFDYNGHRLNLTQEGYEFIDLPNALSAARLFDLKRAENLISYAGPVEYYVKNKILTLDNNILIIPLGSITTHYAIAKKSPQIRLLKKVLNDYAKKHSFEYFAESERLIEN